VAEPFCRSLSDSLESAVRSTSATVHRGGVFIAIEGPRFSTRAESNTYRAWGMSLVGMTVAPEAFLAREAEMCYAVMAHVTDYDVWHVSETPVTVEMIIDTLNRNTRTAQEAIRNLASQLQPRACRRCGSALASALITDPARIPPETKEKLKPIIGKYLP
jgi:5'-methylthioadenosine phosphorylase